MDLISMKPVDVMISPQNTGSWGSATTDCICASAIIACQTMNDRLKQVAETMDDPTWQQLIKECYNRGVDLTVHHL